MCRTPNVRRSAAMRKCILVQRDVTRTRSDILGGRGKAVCAGERSVCAAKHKNKPLCCKKSEFVPKSQPIFFFRGCCTAKYPISYPRCKKSQKMQPIFFSSLYLVEENDRNCTLSFVLIALVVYCSVYWLSVPSVSHRNLRFFWGAFSIDF